MFKNSTIWLLLGIIVFLIAITPTYVNSLAWITNIPHFPEAMLLLSVMAGVCICIAALKWCEENQ
jgi:uncharacterized Tic20 family protein